MGAALPGSGCALPPRSPCAGTDDNLVAPWHISLMDRVALPTGRARGTAPVRTAPYSHRSNATEENTTAELGVCASTGKQPSSSWSAHRTTART